MDAEMPGMTSEARVATTVPRRYLTQLCKHFQHKIPVELGEAEGRIEFAMGVCTLDAASVPDTLIMQATAPDEDALTKLEGVVGRHLERFAFRDALTVAWVRR